MIEVVGAILPLAIAVTISPLPIIGEILLLFSKKPVANAGAYLAGFVLGITVVLGVLVTAADAAGLGASESSSSSSGVQVAAGVLLLVGSFRRFRSRPGEGEMPPEPSWMNGITDFSPAKSFGVGTLIGAANPKNVAMAFGAAAAISAASLSNAQTAGTVVVYVVLAGLGVAAPLILTVVRREAAQTILNDWKTWLAQNNAAVMSVLFLVFGVVLLGRGLGEL